MATILLTWEAGGGLGHLINLRPLANGLAKHGHRVFAALRDLSRAEFALGGSDVEFLQAPAKYGPANPEIAPPQTFAHILHNIGFSNRMELGALVSAWRHLYEYVQPNLVIYDHSPTALLASRGVPAARALIGTGFFNPLPSDQLPNLRPWLPADSAKLRADEEFVLANANSVITKFEQPPLRRLTELYEDIDESFLMTFRELDHYGPREGATYRGAWTQAGGRDPVWPKGDGKRIFAYLKSFPALGRLLQALRDGNHPSIVYVSGLPTKIKSNFATQSLHFVDEPLNMQKITATCDVAILNGTHGSTVAMLLAGKPTLQIPIFLEQGIFAQAVARLGAAVCAPAESGDAVASSLDEILTHDRYALAAREFAERYSDFDPKDSIDKAVARAHDLAIADANG